MHKKSLHKRRLFYYYKIKIQKNLRNTKYFVHLLHTNKAIMKSFTTPTQLETYKLNGKSITIFKTQKVGTKRVFFFPVTDTDKRLNNVQFARKSNAIGLGKQYLKN